MSDKKLKFGILCNSLNFQQWQATAIHHLLNDPHFELELIVINNNPIVKESYFKKIFSSTLLFRQYETRFLKVEAKKPVTLDARINSVDTLKVKTINKGKYSQYFQETDIKEIENKNLDFLIRFGFGILKGDILNAAKYGIWSFHHGDEKEFRGGPPGFWEILRNKSTTSCILQRLTPTLDGGIVLKKGTFKTTNHSYSYHLNTLFTHTAIWIKQVGLDILYNNKPIEVETDIKEPLPLNKAPKNLTFILFLFVLFRNKLKFWFTSLFQVEIWAVGILKNKKEELFSNVPLQAQWLDDDKKLSYRADPFITTINNHQVIFFERYNYTNHKGHIAATIIDGANVNEQEILKTNSHYSYPFIFKNKEQLYCVPEGYMEKAAKLYSIGENLKLASKKTLLPRIEAIDTSILFYNNKYWLFCTINKWLHNAQLYIFYSDSLDDEFTPHLLNPVKTDIASARPAGSFFEYEGNIIRPSQNCSETYGGSLMLNKISKLSETEYKEELIKELKPFDKQFDKGFHHISMDGDTIAIDSKKYIYSLSQAFKRMFG